MVERRFCKPVVGGSNPFIGSRDEEVEMEDKVKLFDSAKKKAVCSKDYNYVYDKHTGNFARWGRTFDDDPTYSPVGPEIADIEISTICNGVKGPCKFCYKGATGKGENMSLETFKRVFSKMPKALTQIAFGIGDIDANPDMFSIFEHCRVNGVVPNVTINGARMTDDHVYRLAELCGAVAVSRYDPPDVCYDAVKRLSEAGVNQINIHKLLSEETFDECMQTIDDAAQDPRLEALRSIVFLALKPKGRGYVYRSMRDPVRYRKLVDAAFASGVGIGFDSCSAPLFLKAMQGHKRYTEYEMMAEPCESTLFSVYIDVRGRMHPCSFLEDIDSGVDVANCEDFMRDVWFGSHACAFREKLLRTAKEDSCLVAGCRQCPVFDIY